MLEFFSNIAVLPLFLTLGAYQVGLWCQKKWKNPLSSPILISVLLIIVVLLVTGYPVEVYQKGAAQIAWLMTPATISLAVPLYGQLQVLKKNLPAILAGIAAGAVTALLFILGFCTLLKMDDVITVSLLPKSITTAIGMVLSEESGGIPALTSMAIFVTGLIGAMAGKPLCRLFRLKDPISQGVAIGTASHAFGTYTAMEISPLHGAVSSLSLAVAGLFTAVIFPLVLMLL